MLSSSQLTAIIFSAILLSTFLYLLAKRSIIRDELRETLFQVWNTATILILVIVIWRVVFDSSNVFPNLTLFFLAIRYSALFFQRALIILLTPRMGDLSPPAAEEWFQKTSKTPSIFTRLYQISAYLTISIYVEFAAWIIAILLKPPLLNRITLFIFLGYLVISLLVIFLLSYQPYRRDNSVRLLRESFASAAYDLPQSLLVVLTYLAYRESSIQSAILVFAAAFTISKFIRYFATGQGLRRKLQHTVWIFYLQPVATLFMALGLYNLSKF